MRRVSFLAVMVCLSCCVGHALAKEAPAPRDTVALNSVTAGRESLRAFQVEALRTVLDRVRERQHVSIADNVTLRNVIELLTKDTILGLTAGGRQELVRKTIGGGDYSMLEQIFLNQLASSDGGQQRLALRSLGYPLFAVDAAEAVKPFVFHSDRLTQYSAVQSLVYLDVPGAPALLKDMIGSGALTDPMLSWAIEALHVSNDRTLDGLAMYLLENNPGPITFKALIPILKTRADYHDIVGRVFTSNIFYVPDREDLSMEERAKTSAEHHLLEEIVSNPKLYMTDDAIERKVVMYARTVHNQRYILALVTLEKWGQDLSFFVEMMKDSQLPAAKKQTLGRIIDRIQSGRRLTP